MRIGLAGGAIAVITGRDFRRADDGFEFALLDAGNCSLPRSLQWHEIKDGRSEPGQADARLQASI
jgi:hypothetical protein